MTSNNTFERPDIMLDLERLKNNCHNNLDITKELLRHLLDKSGPKWIQAIESALAAGDAKALEETCHSMKGSSATVFAWRISNIGFDFELLAHNGQLDTIRDGLPKLLGEFEELRNWLTDNL